MFVIIKSQLVEVVIVTEDCFVVPFKMDNTTWYRNFVAAYEKVYVMSETKQTRLAAAQKEWNSVKYKLVYDQLMLQPRSKAAQHESKTMKLWLKASVNAPSKSISLEVSSSTRMSILQKHQQVRLRHI